jgi:hypothetical protein
MKELSKQVLKRVIEADPAYRNLVNKEYRRHRAAHAKADKELNGSHESKVRMFIAHHLRAVVSVSIAILLLSMVLFTEQLITAVTAGVLLLLASYSTYYKRKLGMPLGGVELVTFGTVLTGMALGPTMGLLFGVISATASEVLSAGIGPLTWIYILTMAVIGMAVSRFPDSMLFAVGMGVVVINLLINQVIYLFIGDEDVKSMTAIYLVVNLFFNAILFGTIGVFIFNLLA